MSQHTTDYTIKPTLEVSESLRNFTSNDRRIPPYFWGEDCNGNDLKQPPRYPGYNEAREIIGDGSNKQLEVIIKNGLEVVKRLFDVLHGRPNKEIFKAESHSQLNVVDVRFSSELLSWKLDQHSCGKVLPGKGKGLRPASPELIELLGAENWPAPLKTTNVLFGTGWTNLIIGAYDARTLYSNYCCDLGFYYEHGFHKVFPDFERSIAIAARDPKAMSQPHGAARRYAVDFGLQYIRGKAEMEEENASKLVHKIAKIDRHTAHIICFCEASLTGMAAEAIGRGFDPGACFDDMVFSSPGTDVVDVGSDVCNSEIMNSFLNTADVTDTGVITEETLRRVYDSYAVTGARCLTMRWMEPLTVMNSLLYVWHILNDRHHFLRRVVLGWEKVRTDEHKTGQREADFDEAFDERFHTTGFSRPLEAACDGNEPTCSSVEEMLNRASGNDEQRRACLANLWSNLVIAPLTYARSGTVDAAHEEEISQALAVSMAKCYHDGLILEQQWLFAHASHHAWQVNYLMEAAMFGSLLDDGSLKGTVDRSA